jgi:hypothetical protein
MRISRRVPITVFIAALAALSAALVVGALSALGSDGGHGKGHGGQLIKESLAPSLTTDPTFHGVVPGGAPWVLKEGSVEVSGHRLDLRVKGLVIPAPPGDNTPGPVTTIGASLYCGADSDTMAAETTGQVSINRKGDARIRDNSFEVPSTCLAPVILVQPNGSTTAYIALDGWRM